MDKGRLVQKKEVEGLSGTIKFKGGKAMRTINEIKRWSREFEMETKMGVKRAYEILDPSELPLDVKKMIFDDFYPVAMSAFSQNKSVQFEADVFHHLFEVDGLILVFNEGVGYSADENVVEKGIAFRTYTTFETPFGRAMYIEGTAVDPNYQGYGFYQAFTKSTVEGCSFVTSRTQNPVVVTALSKIFGSVAPISCEPDFKEKAVKVGKILADKLGMDNYDEKEMVSKGFYGKALNGVKPRIENDIQKRMSKLVNADKGDCLIAVCENNLS
jgi:hypothetical protein